MTARLARFVDGVVTPLAIVPAEGSSVVALGAGPGAMHLFCLAPVQAGVGAGAAACEPLGAILGASGCNATGSDCLLRLETAGRSGRVAEMLQSVMILGH